MENEDQYAKLKRQLAVDPMRLTEELVELPSLQQEAAEFASNAQHHRDECKDAVEVAKAVSANGLREDDAAQNRKQRSEAQIDKDIMLDDHVLAALADLRMADYDLALWKSLSDGVRTKTASIRTISDLIQAGYTTPSSLYEKRKDELNQHRRRITPATQRG